MSNKTKKILYLFAFFIFFIICVPACTYAASDFTLKKLDFNATLMENGDMEVTETWNVKIHDETNTLFKTFKLDNKKYNGITNVSVEEVDSYGETKQAFRKIQEEMYHVTTNCFYALKNKNGDFEIAWGINKSSGEKNYQIKYTVKNVVKVYNDCSELYWQFIGENFKSDAKKVTGIINLPSKVDSLDNLRAWAHGPLNGDIQRKNTDTITFVIEPFEAGRFVEVRIVTLEDIFTTSTNRINQNKFESILQEETKWADKANKEREWIKQKQIIMQYVILGAGIAFSVLYLWRISVNYKKLKESPKLEPTTKLEYFREIPNENATQAEVAFLYYFNGNTLNSHMPQVLSSTMLDLCMKKFIEFEVVEDKKNEFIVNILEGKDTSILKESELEIYQLLSKIGNRFSMKDLEKYAKKHNTSFLKSLDKVKQKAEKEQVEAKNYDTTIRKKHDNFTSYGVLYIFVAFFGMMMGIPIAIEMGAEKYWIAIVLAGIFSIINAIIDFNIAGRYTGLTQKGMDEKEQLKGLKKYMEDFSMIDEREVPELALWEKYLIYATTFGIADKVLKQLKVKYPELSDEEYMRNYSYMYMMSRGNFSTSFVNSLNNSVSRAYQSSVAASNASSGGGYGGGFSGCGGRWPAEAEAGGGR